MEARVATASRKMRSRRRQGRGARTPSRTRCCATRRGGLLVRDWPHPCAWAARRPTRRRSAVPRKTVAACPAGAVLARSTARSLLASPMSKADRPLPKDRDRVGQGPTSCSRECHLFPLRPRRRVTYLDRDETARTAGAEPLLSHFPWFARNVLARSAA